MRSQVLYWAAQVRLNTASQPCIFAESFLDCSNAACIPSPWQVWSAVPKTERAVGRLAPAFVPSSDTDFQPVPSACGVTIHCNLVSTQHHQGKEMPRKQRKSAGIFMFDYRLTRSNKKAKSTWTASPVVASSRMFSPCRSPRPTM